VDVAVAVAAPRPLTVALCGAGLMGSQIAAEYALGGHAVTVVARDPAAARDRIACALALAAETGVATEPDIAAANDRLSYVADPDAVAPDTDLVIESIAEDLPAKGALLTVVGAAAPDATLTSNTSSLSIRAIGEACGYPERTIGTHYWNPPLLMPLVEVIVSETTAPGRAERVETVLREMGKRPVRVARDVPGFVWNRLQLALLREAVWIAEQGVADPAAIDEIVRDGLARRWRYTGPFETAALGGAATFERIADNLWPELSAAETLAGLRRWLPGEPEELAFLRERRDRGLADDLRQDHHRGRNRNADHAHDGQRDRNGDGDGDRRRDRDHEQDRDHDHDHDHDHNREEVRA
jgi:3-hydroxybutyryl-CoA dehydrogenase